MDSMRSLDTSLPQHQPRRHHKPNPKPSAELLQAFKAAALSVTQLYKTATATAEESDESDDERGFDEGKLQEAHESGYQTALDELLGFLDEGELGLGDGEGWCVREWATRRLRNVESTRTDKSTGRDEDTKMDNESLGSAGSTNADLRPRPARRRLSSLERARTAQRPLAQEPNAKDMISSSPPPQQASHAIFGTGQSPSQHPEVFHFRSTALPQPRQQYPDNGSSSTTSSADNTPTLPSRRSPTAIRLEIKPATRSTRSHTRQSHAHTNHQRILERGSSGVSATTGLGHGAGVKRKPGLMEFFDVSGAGDEHGGGKRGRLG